MNTKQRLILSIFLISMGLLTSCTSVVDNGNYRCDDRGHTCKPCINDPRHECNRDGSCTYHYYGEDYHVEEYRI